MWPKIKRPENTKDKVSFAMNELDPLGEEKKKEIISEITLLVVYIKALEAALDAYDIEKDKHNAKFKETVISGKPD